MAINFPTSLDTLSNPSSSDKLNAGSGHASQHANLNDAVEALQAKVGVDSSAVTTSLDYRVNALEDTTPTAGTYTPTLTAGTGVDSVTLAAARYVKSASVAFVTVDFDAGTDDTEAVVYISLPAASDLDFSGSRLGGSGTARSTVGFAIYYAPVYVTYDAASDRAEVRWAPTTGGGASGDSISVTFAYDISA